MGTVEDGEIFVAHIARCGNDPNTMQAVGDGDIIYIPVNSDLYFSAACRSICGKAELFRCRSKQISRLCRRGSREGGTAARSFFAPRKGRAFPQIDGPSPRSKDPSWLERMTLLSSIGSDAGREDRSSRKQFPGRRAGSSPWIFHAKECDDIRRRACRGHRYFRYSRRRAVSVWDGRFDHQGAVR